jgi:hypothetical protein
MSGKDEAMSEEFPDPSPETPYEVLDTEGAATIPHVHT